MAELAEDLHEVGWIEKQSYFISICEMSAHQSLQIVDYELRHHLKGLVHVQRFKQSGDVLKILEEGFGSIALDWLDDDSVDLVYIADIFRVYPDDWYDVEESSTFVVVFGVAKYCVVDVLEEVADHWVKEILERMVLISLQIYVDRLE